MDDNCILEELDIGDLLDNSVVVSEEMLQELSDGRGDE